jgi:mannose/fructose/N-acetylgalactosamine-specific phosphotransferase system component IIB
MSLMRTFPEWSDEDEDDEFRRPWKNDEKNDDSDGWPEFEEPNWRDFSHSRIVSITAVPSDEDRNDVDTRGEDSSVLTLSSMAGVTVELSGIPRPTTHKTRLLGKKLPMLLCKSARIKQPSPGDKRVRFAYLRGEEEEQQRDSYRETRDFIIPRQLERDIYRETRDVIVPRQLQLYEQPVSQQQWAQKLFPSPVEAYSGKCSPSNWIHNANLFHDNTLPSNTLDFFCRDSAFAKVSYSEEETVSSSSSSNAPSLPGGVVDEKLAHFFGLSSIDEDFPNHRFACSKRPNKRSSTNRTIDEAPVSSTALDTTEGHPPSTPRPHVQEKPAVKSFTHLPPSGSTVADRQRWLNEAFKRPQVGKDRVLTDKTKKTLKTSSSATGSIKFAKVTDMAKATPKTSSNVTGSIETFAKVTDKPKAMPKAMPKTSSNVTGTIEKFGGKMTRQSAVQLRRQELERAFALKNETLKNEGKPSFNTRWEGRPGSYKKKVVLSTYGL